MCEINELVGLGIVSMLAVQDYRKKSLPRVILIVLFAASVGFRMYLGEELISWVLCVLPGMLFFLISYVTKEGVGYGDSYVILILGIYLGIRNTIGICMIAVLCMALLSMVGMAFWHWKRTKRLPFLPFLALGCLGMMIW